MWTGNIFITTMDNQFINAPLLVNKSTYTDPKDELIKKLQTKNAKLKGQLIKIQRTVEQKFGNLDEQAGPKKRESIFQHEDNFQVLTKELANTYKRIKMYEYEVNKLEDPNRLFNVGHKTSQYDQIIKQKKGLAQKLKVKLIKEQKLTQDNIKKLEGNSQREELELAMRKLTEEAKFFKETLKALEAKQSIKASNMKRQYDAIKKYENQLLEGGLAGGELEQLKRAAVSSIKASPTRRTMQQTKRNREQTFLSGSQEEVEDRTREHYNALLSQVALLQKMQNDHEKQMIKAFDQKVESINRNMDSRNRLLECENEIENLEKEIQVIKSKYVPSNLKPTKPLRSLSSHQGENPNKLMPAKYIGSTTIKSKASRQLNKINTQRLHKEA